jgi:hypothetical protein
VSSAFPSVFNWEYKVRHAELMRQRASTRRSEQDHAE